MIITVQMLDSGAVDAVVCVQSDPNDRWARRESVIAWQLQC
jgi:coenzyme F420-reducing hydrogenase beta subunit